MRLGVIRHGPWAPVACQLGKYDVRTTTGLPTRSTSKLIRSSVTLTWVGRTRATGTRGGFRSPARTRGHEAGPAAASGTGQRFGSWYQGTDRSSQALALVTGPVTTAGSYWSGATMPAPETS